MKYQEDKQNKKEQKSSSVSEKIQWISDFYFGQNYIGSICDLHQLEEIYKKIMLKCTLVFLTIANRTHAI